jgi:TolB protein
MKKIALLVFFFILFSSKAISLTIEVSNPNLRPFKIYVANKNVKDEVIINNLVNYLSLMPNVLIVDDIDNADYALNYVKKGNIINLNLSYLKTSEAINFEIRKGSHDEHEASLKLADMVFENISQSKGIFSSQVVFSMNWHGVRQIFISDIVGKKIRKITDNITDSIAPKLSPDRNYIIYTRYFKSGGTSLRLINLKNLDDIPIYSSKGLNVAGSFTEDGKKFFFISYDGIISKLMSYNLTNGEMEVLYSSRSRLATPVIIYNKDAIAFVSDELGRPQVFLFNLKNKSIKRITYKHNYATSPSFAPPGTHFVYVALVNGINKIFASSIDGNDFALLTPVDKSFEDPHWSKNERFVFALSSEKDNSSLYLIDISTLKFVKMFTLPAKIGYVYIN